MKRNKSTILVIAAVAMLGAACGTDPGANNAAMNTANMNRGNMMTNNANMMNNNANMANTNMANANANMGPGATTTVAAIKENPDNWAGKTVTVVADLEEVWGPRAFSLDEDAPLRGGIDNDMIVVGAKTGSLANVDDTWRNNKVRVTGTVRRFALVEIEREIGWDLDPKIEAELEDREAIIVASNIERLPQN